MQPEQIAGRGHMATPVFLSQDFKLLKSRLRLHLHVDLVHASNKSSDSWLA
jgi:hypothetical protein